MIAIISWADMHMRFLKTSEQVYVKEEENRWLFYAASGPIILKSVVDKSDDQARNAAFVDRYLNQINIVKIIDYIEKPSINIRVDQEEKGDY